VELFEDSPALAGVVVPDTFREIMLRPRNMEIVIFINPFKIDT
jgi:hypothetical protein